MVFSGLIRRLVQDRPVVLLSRVIDGDFVKHLPADCSLVHLPIIRIPGYLSRLSTLANRAHGVWMDRTGMMRALEGRAGEGLHAATTAKRIRNNLGSLMASRTAVEGLTAVESAALRFSGAACPHLRELIRRWKPGAFLSMDSVHPSAALMACLARRAGGRSFFCSGNWKDVGRGFRARPCFDQFLVWNDQMRRDLLRQNPRLASRKVRSVGASQFDLLRHPEFIETREAFCARFALAPARLLLCYTCAARRVIPHESATIRDICRSIARHEIAGDPYLLVRLNPTGSDPQIERLAAEFDFVRISAPAWDYRPSLAGGPWQASDYEDLIIYASMIRHAAANLSAPSTVILDFAVADKPVVNVGYDPPGMDVAGRSVGTFAKQDVFQSAVNLSACRLAGRPEELRGHLNAYLHCPDLDRAGRLSFVREQLGSDPRPAAARIADVLLES